MLTCKDCKGDNIIKNGFVREKQRYKCKDCGLNFIEGDARINEKIIAKKAMCLIFHSLGKVSYNKLADIFDTWPSLVYRWVVEAGAKQAKQDVSGEIKQIERDEIGNFIEKKCANWSSKPLTVASGELWPGCSAVVILQHSDSSTTK